MDFMLTDEAKCSRRLFSGSRRLFSSTTFCRQLEILPSVIIALDEKLRKDCSRQQKMISIRFHFSKRKHIHEIQ